VILLQVATLRWQRSGGNVSVPSDERQGLLLVPTSSASVSSSTGLGNVLALPGFLTTLSAYQPVTSFEHSNRTTLRTCDRVDDLHTG
jgi:hypothetical protein